MSVADNIAQTVKVRRKELGLTLDDVATRCGASKSHIWAIEAGRNPNPTINMALSLCEALSISLNQLLGVDVSQPQFTAAEMALIAAHREIFGGKA